MKESKGSKSGLKMLQLEKFTCISEVWCIIFRASRVPPTPHPTQKLKKELADTVDLPILVTKCGKTTTRAAGRVNKIDALKYGKWGEGRALCTIGAGEHGPFSMKGDFGVNLLY